MEDGIEHTMMETPLDYACMPQNNQLFVHISQEKYILTEDVKQALEFSKKNKCAVKIYTMDKTTGCYKLSDECLG